MPSLQLLILALLRCKEQRSITLRSNLTLIKKRRRDRRITRKALQSPSSSAFEILFGSGCDQSLVTLCSFNHRFIRYLQYIFEPLYLRYTPYSQDSMLRVIPVRPLRRGRPRSLSPIQCFALTLT